MTVFRIFDTESIVTRWNAVVRNSGSSIYIVPLFVDAFSRVGVLAVSCSRIIQCRKTETEGRLIIIKVDDIGIWYGRVQNPAATICFYFLIENIEISQNDRVFIVIGMKILGIECHKSVDTSEIEGTVLSFDARIIAKLLALQPVRKVVKCLDRHCFRIEIYQSVVGT